MPARWLFTRGGCHESPPVGVLSRCTAAAVRRPGPRRGEEALGHRGGQRLPVRGTGRLEMYRDEGERQGQVLLLPCLGPIAGQGARERGLGGAYLSRRPEQLLPARRRQGGVRSRVSPDSRR